MACEFIQIPGGARAIVCGTRRHQALCICGRPAPLLCDWKTPENRSGTCDRPICKNCSTSPAPDKDLCPKHARAFQRWKEGKANG